jgi:hypothetical protein
VKNIIAKIPLVGQTNPSLSDEAVNQHPLRRAIRRALRDTTRTRIVPFVALSLVGLAAPALGQQATVELSSLNGSNGFVINGVTESDKSGYSVSAAGDINGDGVDDLLIGSGVDPYERYSGTNYVVFGVNDVGSSGVLELSSLDGSNGFALNGVPGSVTYSDFVYPVFSPYSVSAAGDVNGDGFDDLLIGARRASPNGEYSGASYVVFGASEAGADGLLELSVLDGSNGFVLNGVAEGDQSGHSVSTAGDVNGDGIDDLLIGAPKVVSDDIHSGASYVVFGASRLGSGGTLELSALDGSNGFVLNGVAARDYSGGSVSAAGDINGDGIDDLLIGAQGVALNGEHSGASYVVFGANNVGNGGSLNLSALNSSTGFVINGATADDQFGSSVSAAGDVNGDGVDDLLIGAPNADPNNDYSRLGVSYVVFGSSEVGASGSLALFDLNGRNGFVLVNRDSRSGYSVSAAGDVNGDGVDDLLIGAVFTHPNGNFSGASYVVFGASDVGIGGIVELSNLNGNNGFVLNGAAAGERSGRSVSAAGDVNNDGVDDLLIGAPGADPNGEYSGASYVVFGQAAGDPIDDPVHATLDIPVSASSDDAEENTATGKVNRGSSDLELVDQGRQNQIVGMRFNGLNIPKGATITKASVQFQVDETHSGSAALMIQGQATDNASTFTNANRNISFRDRTNAVVDWSPVPWTTVGEAGADQQTPDITLVIQEIVNRQRWTSGNSLAIIITGSGQHTAESFNGNAAGAPVLHVEYQ